MQQVFLKRISTRMKNRLNYFDFIKSWKCQLWVQPFEWLNSTLQAAWYFRRVCRFAYFCPWRINIPGTWYVTKINKFACNVQRQSRKPSWCRVRVRPGLYDLAAATSEDRCEKGKGSNRRWRTTETHQIKYPVHFPRTRYFRLNHSSPFFGDSTHSLQHALLHS